MAILLIAVAIVGLVQLSNYFWQNPPKEAVAQEFVVEEGESFVSVAQDLKGQGIIANVMWFRLMAEFAGLTDNVQVGTYILYPGEDYKTTLATLTAGTTEGVDVRVTITEGFTLKQMGEVLEAKGLVTQEEWAAATAVDSPLETHEFVVAAQKPGDVDLEGYLFPDTYRFAYDASAEDIARIMLDNMAEQVNDAGRPNGDAAEMTIHEILTLASIIEREVRQPSTMKNVADIFLKRLDIGMALQADSTVNYVIEGDSPSITLDQRDNTESPYNTYKYPGLPPGPISAPSANAIDAVLNPTANNYLYFLTTDDGEIYYAETHDEHVRNKAQYLD
jgi:UPF0755 protein